MSGETAKNIREKFIEIQRELMPLDYKPDGNGQFKYVTWGKLCKTIMPVVSSLGCGLCFSVDEARSIENGKATICVSIEMFNETESMRKDYNVIYDYSKKAIQDTGGAFTYAKRYALQMFFALPIGEYDPDAFSDEPKNTAQTPKNENKPRETRAERDIKDARKKVSGIITKNGLKDIAAKWTNDRGLAWQTMTIADLAELKKYLLENGGKNETDKQ